MNQEALPPDASRFRWLAFAASLATFLLIVAGGIVRVTGSGMGCGEHWPLCNGQLFPPLDLPTFIEISHRFIAAATSPLIVAAAFVAWRRYRNVRWIVAPLVAAVGLLVVQILLGAVTVQLTLPPTIVALHLANALALFGLLLAATVVAFQIHRDPRVGDSLLHFDVLSGAAGMTLVAVFLLIIAGALVTATRSAAACLGWPLCSGSLVPDTPRAWLHMLHRYVAGAAGLMLLVSTLQAWRLRRTDTAVVVSAMVACALFAGQVLIGATNVLNSFPTFINGLHVATSAAAWGSVVVFAVLALQRARLSPLRFPVPPVAEARLSPGATLADYVALTKPVIMILLLTTTAAAMIVAGRGWPPLDLLAWTLLGGALASGGASALNQVIDRDLDSRMARTSRRPMAAGRVDFTAGLAFGLVLSIASFYILAVFVNPASALLALLGHLYYVLGYTVLLKKSTAQNIVIGGGAGAIPALVGWAAAAGRINLPALFLFALVFFWTPPHFWALSLLKKNDYARAGVPMLPVVWGESETRRQIFLYTLVVVALSLLLAPARVAGMIYLAAASVLGAGFIAYALHLWRVGSNRSAWRLYKYSSLYLALIFAALVVDQLVRV